MNYQLKSFSSFGVGAMEVNFQQNSYTASLSFLQMGKAQNQGPQKSPLPVFAALKAHLYWQERSRKLRKLVSFLIHEWNKGIWNKPRSCLVGIYLCSEQFLQSLHYLIQISKAQIPKLFSVTWNGTAKQWWLYAVARYHILATVPHGNNVNMKIEGAVSSFNYSKFHIYVKNNICFLLKELLQ